MDFARLLGGGLLLYLGAEWFVAGASALALALRVPQVLIGLTIVAYGTSAPEVVVGIEAAAEGHGAVALANVIGSNIANIGLILGVCALIKPARVDSSLRRRELPVLLASAALVPLVLLDGVLVRWEALGLLGLALLYSTWMIRTARGARIVTAVRRDAAAEGAAADAAGAPTTKGAWRATVTAFVGLLTLLVGGSLFVDGAVALAGALGVSERLIGLTVVALGTSLPELSTSIIAARRGHSDLAVGNVIGSNIFNILLCLGGAAMFGAIHLDDPQMFFDLGALLLMTGLAAVFIRSERAITRLEGGTVLVLYLIFIAVTIVRG